MMDKDLWLQHAFVSLLNYTNGWSLETIIETSGISESLIFDRHLMETLTARNNYISCRSTNSSKAHHEAVFMMNRASLGEITCTTHPCHFNMLRSAVDDEQ